MFHLVICLALLLWLDVVGAAAASLKVLNLSDVSWTLKDSTGNVSVPATVSSLAHLDLYKSSTIGLPVYDENDQEQLWVACANWTYVSQPLIQIKAASNTSTYLVFNGLDTFAAISFCNITLGTTNNQFRQWVFDVSSVLFKCNGSPSLEVAFTSAPLMAAYLADGVYNGSSILQLSTNTWLPNRNVIRKEQSDFGWNWSPAFSPTGIWQPAVLLQVPSEGAIYVKNALVDVYREGQLNNIPPDQTQPWILNISVDYVGPQPHIQSININITDQRGEFLFASVIKSFHITNETIQGNVVVDAKPSVWWPVGYGNQSLYNLHASFRGASGNELASFNRRIGFRTIVLNQLPITKAQQAQGIGTGANWHFEINGRPLFCKGSNLVPLDVFWPNVTTDDVRDLFTSAVDGNQNMLRVWASGVYLPDFAYDLADEMGILLWSEFEFSDALYPTDPTFIENIYQEAYYQTRRVNHHPSLALWAGGNEIQLFIPAVAQLYPDELQAVTQAFEKLFMDILLHVVFDNSRSISYSPSSTTNGYLSLNHSAATPMIERYNVTSGEFYSNTDYYNYDLTQAFNISAFPLSRFTNEFGFVSHPSYETYANYMPLSELKPNSSSLIHRNRRYNTTLADAAPGVMVNLTQVSLGGLGELSQGISLYYPVPTDVVDGAAAAESSFKAEIYSTQIFQAEFYRSQIEYYRWGSGQPQRTMGSLYWQLNDVWAAPTWSSIDTDRRWKALHHVAQRSYESVIVAPLVFDSEPGKVEVWAVSDLWETITANTSITWYNWAGVELSSITGTTDGNSDSHVTVGPINATRVTSIDFRKDLPFNSAEAVAFLRINASVPGHQMVYTAERVFHLLPLNNALTMQSMKGNATRSPITVSHNNST